MGLAEGKCQYDFYTEERGWQECGDKATHVHHIRGEAETLLAGDNPEENVGLPLCQNHHVRNTSDSEHTREFSFHPDMGFAYQDYSEWKKNEEHMNSITGRRKLDYSTSPFADAAREHKVKAERGERYIAGTEEIDEHYRQKMLLKATRAFIETGEAKKQYKPHPKYDPSLKRHWSDGLFD